MSTFKDWVINIGITITIFVAGALLLLQLRSLKINSEKRDPQYQGTLGGYVLYRKRVPHGWLYFIRSNSECMTFVQDEEGTELESSEK